MMKFVINVTNVLKVIQHLVIFKHTSKNNILKPPQLNLKNYLFKIAYGASGNSPISNNLSFMLNIIIQN